MEPQSALLSLPESYGYLI